MRGQKLLYPWKIVVGPHAKRYYARLDGDKDFLLKDYEACLVEFMYTVIFVQYTNGYSD
jgi:hypothetical protein